MPNGTQTKNAEYLLTGFPLLAGNEIPCADFCHAGNSVRKQKDADQCNRKNRNKGCEGERRFRSALLHSLKLELIHQFRSTR